MEKHTLVCNTKRLLVHFVAQKLEHQFQSSCVYFGANEIQRLKVEASTHQTRDLGEESLSAIGRVVFDAAIASLLLNHTDEFHHTYSQIAIRALSYDSLISLLSCGSGASGPNDFFKIIGLAFEATPDQAFVLNTLYSGLRDVAQLSMRLSLECPLSLKSLTVAASSDGASQPLGAWKFPLPVADSLQGECLKELYSYFCASPEVCAENTLPALVGSGWVPHRELSGYKRSELLGNSAVRLAILKTLLPHNHTLWPVGAFSVILEVLTSTLCLAMVFAAVTGPPPVEVMPSLSERDVIDPQVAGGLLSSYLGALVASGTDGEARLESFVNKLWPNLVEICWRVAVDRAAKGDIFENASPTSPAFSLPEAMLDGEDATPMPEINASFSYSSSFCSVSSFASDTVKDSNDVFDRSFGSFMSSSSSLASSSAWSVDSEQPERQRDDHDQVELMEEDETEQSVGPVRSGTRRGLRKTAPDYKLAHDHLKKRDRADTSDSPKARRLSAGSNKKRRCAT